MNPSLRLLPNQADRPSTLPKPNDFLAPLLHTLAMRTCFQPQVFVPVALGKKRCALKDEVLSVCGYDSDDEASLPGMRYSVSPPGMYRQIWYTARNFSTDFLIYRQRKYLPLFVLKDDQWALTEAGMAEAAKLHQYFPCEKNVTGIWLDGFTERGGLIRVLRVMENAPALRKEKASGEIPGHLHDYISSCIGRDSLLSWLSRGDIPTSNQLIEWAIRRAISSFRKYSHDALGRHVRGALTDKERKEGGCSIKGMVASPYVHVIQAMDEDNPEDTERVIVNTEDNRINRDVAWNESLERINDALRDQKSGAPERYESILGHMLAGVKVEELGKLENVSKNRAASLMADTRTALRAAQREASDARAIMRYLSVEPWADFRDIEEDIPNVENKESLLQKLLDRGRVERCRGSYKLTATGETMLEAWENREVGDLGSFVSY